MFPVTALYAGILGLLYVALSINIILGRAKHHIGLGAGEKHELFRPIRAHGNFMEYVPIALVLLILLEAHGASAYLLHVLGAVLVFGRFFHAYSILYHEQKTEKTGKMEVFFRQIGMVATFAMIVVASLYCLYQALFKGIFVP